jgi:hypothetical protein
VIGYGIFGEGGDDVGVGVWEGGCHARLRFDRG